MERVALMVAGAKIAYDNRKTQHEAYCICAKAWSAAASCEPNAHRQPDANAPFVAKHSVVGATESAEATWAGPGRARVFRHIVFDAIAGCVEAVTGRDATCRPSPAARQQQVGGVAAAAACCCSLLLLLLLVSCAAGAGRHCSRR